MPVIHYLPAGRFGKTEALRRQVRAAHEQGMRIWIAVDSGVVLVPPGYDLESFKDGAVLLRSPEGATTAVRPRHVPTPPPADAP